MGIVLVLLHCHMEFRAQSYAWWQWWHAHITGTRYHKSAVRHSNAGDTSISPMLRSAAVDAGPQHHKDNAMEMPAVSVIAGL